MRVQRTNVELRKAPVTGNDAIFGEMLLLLVEAERHHLFGAIVARVLVLAGLEDASALVLAGLEDAIDEDIDGQAGRNVAIDIQDNGEGGRVLWHGDVGLESRIEVLGLVFVEFDTIRLDFEPTLEIAQTRHDGVFNGCGGERDSFKGLNDMSFEGERVERNRDVRNGR
jgi:hypothetical protein